MAWHVYHLVCPITKSVRYVGSCADPKARFRNHCNEATRRQNRGKHGWINQLIAAGRLPVMVVIARYGNPGQARKREKQEIAMHINTIFNIHDPETFPTIPFKRGKK